MDEPETIYVSNGYSSEISSFSDKYCNSDVDVTMKNDYDTNILQGEFANNTLKLNGLQPGETTLNFTFTTKDGASSFDLAVPVVVSTRNLLQNSTEKRTVSPLEKQLLPKILQSKSATMKMTQSQFHSPVFLMIPLQMQVLTMIP